MSKKRRVRGAIHMTPEDYAAFGKAMRKADAEKKQHRKGPLTPTEYHRQVFSAGHAYLEQLGWILAMPHVEDSDADERIALLMRVGDERKLHPHTDEELRRTARQVLVRFYANESDRRYSSNTVRAIVLFFAADERHCQFTDRDRKHLQGFLADAWARHDKGRIDRYDPYSNALAQALVFAQHHDFLRENDIEEAIPILYHALTGGTASIGDALADRCNGYSQETVAKITALAGHTLRRSARNATVYECAVTLLMLTASSGAHRGIYKPNDSTPSIAPL